MSEQGANEGPTIVKIGFAFDDSLGELIARAKNVYTNQMESHIEASGKGITTSAKELVDLSFRVADINKLISDMDAKADAIKNTVRDAESSVSQIEQTLKTVQIVAKAQESREAVVGAPSLPGVASSVATSVVKQVQEEEEERTQVSKAGAKPKPEAKKKRKGTRSKITGRFISVAQALIEEEETRKEEEIKEVTPDVPTTPLTPMEEITRMEEEKLKRQVEAATSGAVKSGPIAAIRIGVERLKRTVLAQHRLSLWEKETTLGPHTRRGGSIAGDYAPVFRQLDETGEWGQAQFRGQVGLAFGASNVRSFIENRLIQGLRLSKMQLARLKPEERKVYDETIAGIKAGMMMTGSSLRGALAGIDPTTGDPSLSIVAEMPGTPGSVTTMSDFRKNLRTYMDMTAKFGKRQFTDFYKETADLASQVQAGDTEAERMNRAAAARRHPDEWGDPSMNVHAFIADESKTDEDVGGTGDPFVSFLRPREDISLNDPRQLRKQAKLILDRAKRFISTHPGGMPVELSNLGIKTPEDFNRVADAMLETMLEQQERMKYEGSGVTVDPTTGIYGLVEVYKNIYGFGKGKGETVGIASEHYLHQQARERTVLEAIENGTIMQLLDKDPTYMYEIEGLSQHERRPSHKVQGVRSLFDRRVGQYVGVDPARGVGSEHMREAGETPEDLSTMPASGEISEELQLSDDVVKFILEQIQDKFRVLYDSEEFGNAIGEVIESFTDRSDIGKFIEGQRI